MFDTGVAKMAAAGGSESGSGPRAQVLGRMHPVRERVEASSSGSRCPGLLAEMAPAHGRGPMVMINELIFVAGQLAFLINGVLN